MLRVFVALGKQMPKDKAIVEDTQEVARLLAKYNCTMVQGGARMGLMGVVVDGFEKYSNQIVMIVPEVHKSDLDGVNIDEYYIVEGESDRMKITIRTCDMMIVLPGGSGTLAELSYYNETCKSGEHNANIVIINTKGFYNKLFKFHKHQIKTGFMTEEACRYQVINNAKQLEPILQRLIAEKQDKLNIQMVEKQAETVSTNISKPAKQTKTKSTTTSKSVAKKTASAKQSKKETADSKQSQKKIVTTKPVKEKVAKSEVKSKTKKAEKPVVEKEVKPTKEKSTPVAKPKTSKTVKKEVATKPITKSTKSKVAKPSTKTVKAKVTTDKTQPTTTKAKSTTAKTKVTTEKVKLTTSKSKTAASKKK